MHFHGEVLPGHRWDAVVGLARVHANVEAVDPRDVEGRGDLDVL